MRYELSRAGDGLLDRAVLFDMTDAPGEDAIDGIKVDLEGNLFVCGPGGIWVISPAGERLGLLELPEDPHNLAFGGADSPRPLRDRADQRLPAANRHAGHQAAHGEEHSMSKSLEPGTTFPDFTLPDENGGNRIGCRPCRATTCWCFT